MNDTREQDFSLQALKIDVLETQEEEEDEKYISIKSKMIVRDITSAKAAMQKLTDQPLSVSTN